MKKQEAKKNITSAVKKAKKVACKKISKKKKIDTGKIVLFSLSAIIVAPVIAFVLFLASIPLLVAGLDFIDYSEEE